MYIERQNKFITSLEGHTLKFKSLKGLIIRHSLALILITKHIEESLRLL